MIANYVCPSGKHYALEFRRFRKKEDCEFAQQCLEATPNALAVSGDYVQLQANERLFTLSRY